MKKLIIICVAVGVMIFEAVNTEATTYIVFEGYEVGEGAPPVGGTIGSQGIGPPDPWFDAEPYWYMDGWNHEPRVPAGEYVGLWAPGGHAGEGTDLQGWNSLINEEPGRYVFDFHGYEFTSNFFYCEATGYFPGDPEYGHEDRWYHRIVAPGEGEWQILDTVAVTSVASGIVGDVLMDIFYDPLNVFTPDWDPYVLGTGTIIAEDDGGAFYNELMTRWGTPVLNFTGLTEDPPVQSENPNAQQIDKWAVYGTRWTITPVPEPATVCLLGLGSLVLIRRKRGA